MPLTGVFPLGVLLLLLLLNILFCVTSPPLIGNPPVCVFSPLKFKLAPCPSYFRIFNKFF